MVRWSLRGTHLRVKGTCRERSTGARISLPWIAGPVADRRLAKFGPLASAYRACPTAEAQRLSSLPPVPRGSLLICIQLYSSFQQSLGTNPVQYRTHAAQRARPLLSAPRLWRRPVVRLLLERISRNISRRIHKVLFCGERVGPRSESGVPLQKQRVLPYQNWCGPDARLALVTDRSCRAERSLARTA